MQTWRFGDVTVTRIEELFGPLFDTSTFFPDDDAQLIAAEHSWLKPNYLAEDGRMLASIHTWLIRTQRHGILIDGCIGDSKDRLPFKDWHLMKTGWLANLHTAGVTPEQVDFVMCTHLHVDHVGWNTCMKDGRWVPTFPNARYLFARAEYAYWQQERQHVESNAPLRGMNLVNQKVFDDSILPIIAAGKAEFVDGRHELLDALLCIDPAPGHTPGSVTIGLTTPQRRALFTGDILHHPLQVVLPDWNSSFCAAAEQARVTRRAVLEQCAATRALMMPAHFGFPHAGHVRRAGKTFAFDAVAPDSQ